MVAGKRVLSAARVEKELTGRGLESVSFSPAASELQLPPGFLLCKEKMSTKCCMVKHSRYRRKTKRAFSSFPSGLVPDNSQD